jgi:tryptophanyl-tRNA synthetase
MNNFEKLSKKRILTGDRPTGYLHVGHYVGSLMNRVRLQDEYDTFLMVADVQGLTDNFENPQKISDNLFNVVKCNFAAGIDPNKVTYLIQSMIPEIAELTIFYANLVSVQKLGHNPTVKTELAQKGMEESTPLGFFMYPVSQAADITIFNANLVPVGDDQKPMIEDTREIARKFNQIYGETIVIPEGLYGDIARLIGTDGNAKMGKSLGNAIYLNESKEDLRKKIMSMKTDPNRIHATDPGRVEENPVFIYHDVFNKNIDEVNDLKERYKTGNVGDVEVKEKLLITMENFMAPMREKILELDQKPEFIRDVLMEGTKKARIVAQETMARVREAMKIDYNK